MALGTNSRCSRPHRLAAKADMVKEGSMSTKDDALIKAMDEAFWAPHPPNSTLLDSMRSALAVARKAILEEAAEIAEANSAPHCDACWNDACAEIAILLRSLSTQEQNNGD